MTNEAFISPATETAHASADETAAAPDLRFTARSQQVLSFAFFTGTTVAAVEGWVSGRCALKEFPESTDLLLDVGLDVAGVDTATRYKAVWTAAENDSDALRDFIKGQTLPRPCWCEVEWTDGAGTHRVAFPILLVPAFIAPEDGAPVIADPASEGWLTTRAVRFDAAQSLTDPQIIQALSNVGITNIKRATITVGGFLELTDAVGGLWNVGLNNGAAPA